MLASWIVTTLVVVPVYAAMVPPTPEQEAIIDTLKQEPLALPNVPEGALDSSKMSGQVGRWTAGLSQTKNAREKGNPLAIFLVAERICPDTNEGFCFVTILFELTLRVDSERQVIESTARYAILSSDGKLASGYASSRVEDGVTTMTFWVRRDGTWLQHERDSAEYVVTRGLINVLIALAQHVEMEDKAPLPPPTDRTAN
jgi:hypothetical protein